MKNIAKLSQCMASFITGIILFDIGYDYKYNVLSFEKMKLEKQRLEKEKFEKELRKF